MPCNAADLTINIPPGPSAPQIPGFGSPFAPTAPDFGQVFPDGFPEDLLEILDLLQFILPSGTLKPPLNANFGKDIFDGIMKLLDYFTPFLMLYKFFLPVLELIICIIEVLCALTNPFKLIRALKRLFRTCLPQFLSLFPIFALIVMLLSLLFLILALIEYLITQILTLINILLKNIRTIVKALTKADQTSILAAIQKIAMLLCNFQNLFVLLSIFKTIIDIIKDILKLLFAIPPCDDGDNGNAEKCCSPEVCPSFIKNNDEMQRDTGTFQYYNRAAQDAGLSSLIPALPSGFLTTDVRKESWQFYDANALTPDAFINITSAYDLPAGVTQVFFPTDATYDASTPWQQAPYTVDLRLFYNPANWGRTDTLGARYIRVNNCIVTNAPTTLLYSYDNSTVSIPNGVLKLAGGTFTEDDNTTPIFINNVQATLENFIHMNDNVTVITSPILSPTDGYSFSNVSYTFNINHELLLSKALITLGCIPTVALDRAAINDIFGGNAGPNFTALNDLLNNNNGKVFPDLGGAQDCLSTALTTLRANISEEGVSDFQAATTLCLNKLKDDTNSAINDLISIGFDQYKSLFTLTPTTQFTTQSIQVQVSLNETNGLALASKVPTFVADSIASKIKPTITFGTISNFVYDGYQFFNADITSDIAGTGTIQVSFDNKVLSTAIIPTDPDQPVTTIPQELSYKFVYAPANITSDGDTDGAPRRDDTDISGV